MRLLMLPILPALLLATMGSPAMAQYRALQWTELLPEADYKALLSAPPINHEGGDTGPPPGPLARSEASKAFAGSSFEQALVSTEIRAELDGTPVRLPGFVVPLEYDANHNVTEFFLVPYFGACIHMPPPPPNQIIHVAYPQGLPLPSIHEPYTVEGILATGVTSNATALSAYRIHADRVAAYQE